MLAEAPAHSQPKVALWTAGPSLPVDLQLCVVLSSIGFYRGSSTAEFLEVLFPPILKRGLEVPIWEFPKTGDPNIVP